MILVAGRIAATFAGYFLIFIEYRKLFIGSVWPGIGF
jgi:hypothetical protein